MKNLKFNFIITMTTVILLFAGSACTPVKQSAEATTKSNFLILVETTNDGIKLSCETGCAWEDLSFTIKEFQPQDIDQYGMTIGEQNTSKKKNLADFHFTIKKTPDGVRLEGIKGTKWENLSFNCPGNGCHQYIDENGMTTKK